MKKIKISKKIKLETERLILKPGFYTDPKVLKKNANDFDNANFIGPTFPFPYKLKNAKDFIEFIEKKWNMGGEYVFHIWTKDKNEFVGSVGITYNKNDELISNLGYWTAKEKRGFGYMSEAVKTLSDYCFNFLSVRKVNATVASKNIGSSKVLKKNGFKIEGIRKNEIILKDGDIVDRIFYAKFKK